MESDCTEEERTQSERILHSYYLVLGVPDGRPSLTSPVGLIVHERAEISRERTPQTYHWRICRILWAWRLLTVSCSPLLRVMDQRWLLSAESLRT